MMPEKIWIDYYDGYHVSEQDYTGVGTEYIRKDIHEAEVKRLNKALEQQTAYLIPDWMLEHEQFGFLYKLTNPISEYVMTGDDGRFETLDLIHAPELADWLRRNK